MTDSKPISRADLERYLDEGAGGLLEAYFNSQRFTGGRFERFAGGGDRASVEACFTTDDIVAVSLLGVRIPGRAALQILEVQASQLNSLLSKIPNGTDLWSAPAEAVMPASDADLLWRSLVEIPGIGWVTAGKLMARKRPRLIPVDDRVVRKALGREHDEGWWLTLRNVLVTDKPLVMRLEELRSGCRLGDRVSLLRILDVCIWMKEYGQPEPTPDAES